jgi:hypothetical protein
MISQDQTRILHHTLGLRTDRREPYRNHYVAGQGHHAQADLEALELAGLMERTQSPGFLADGDMVFICTQAGIDHAIDHLPPEPKRTKYQEYLDSDCGLTFAEWMGIEVPRLEYDYRGNFRYIKPVRGYTMWVHGEWKPTKKEAKASYKNALKAFKEGIK